MLSFSSLDYNERKILMLMAYFYKYGQNKIKLSKLLKKIMSSPFSDSAFEKLKNKGLLIEENHQYYGATDLLYINQDLLIPALVELFKKENRYLLKDIRELYRRTYANDKPAPLVGLIIYCIAPKAV